MGSGRKTLTVPEARKLGWEIVRGAYWGTCDDRADRWYYQRIDAREVWRLGSGYRTRKEALQALTEWIEHEEKVKREMGKL